LSKLKSSDEVFIDRFFEALQNVFVASFAVCLPVYADMFGVRGAGDREIRSFSRNLDGNKTYFTMSTIF